ncbi:MAG: hypothetical protein JWO78_1467 [Micavibrio sp.]|nr:hypothetical protein [Micavibrio sp.]
MNPDLKILIIGGYGTFGGRLVELLLDEPSLTLIIAGRSLDKAASYCQARRNGKAHLIPTALDRTGDFRLQLLQLKPDIVVDASGPFQDYGRNAYGLVEACIDRKIHYLDLADGSGFVEGITAYDQSAKSAGVFVLSGVSSFPVLTAAVAKKLSSGMAYVRSIRGGIAPSPYAGVGSNVIQAIAGYAGQKTSGTKAEKSGTAYPLTETMRYTIGPPGTRPLRNTLFSLVDVPDLKVLARLWPEAETIWIGAGPVPENLHRALIALAWLVRLGLVRTLLPLAPLMQYVVDHVRWGEHRGGMFVEIQGETADGQEITRSWHLLAEGRDGPMIPSMAVELIIRRIMAGHVIPPGARTALEDVTLDDYETLFRKRTIRTGFRQDVARAKKSLYHYILGAAWDDIAPEIRSMHDVFTSAEAEGMAEIHRGKSAGAKIIARVFGFPDAGADIPVRVNFVVGNDTETWTRTFARKSFSSMQYAGRGRDNCLLVERFGILTFAMALVWEENRLNLVLRNWRVLGVPLPLWLAPRSVSYESVEEGRFRFNVEISHRLTGLIVHYHGWLVRKM